MTNNVTVVLWKWPSIGNWKRYTAGHVNAVAATIDANLDLPCEFVCVTDDPAEIATSIRIVPLSLAAARTPDIDGLPQRLAYRRLKLFSRDAAAIFGGRRLLQLDLDTVVLGDITPLVDRQEPFLIWKSPSVGHRGYALNTSFVLLDAGTRADICDAYEADPEGVALAARDARWTGTDQAVVAHCAGQNVAMLDERDGIVSFRDHLRNGAVAPSDDIRMVSFMGRYDPADPLLQDRCPWITKYYPYRAAQRQVA